MPGRKELELNYTIHGRSVQVRAMDTVGPDDCFVVLWKATLHRYVTGEDLMPTIPRDVKDWMIKTGRTI